MKDTGPTEAQYLYAIIACSEPRQFKARGIGERSDVVHTINYRRLAAVVSNSPNIEYDSSRRNMMAHTLVLEEVMEQFNLLPVRFGTIAPDVETIETRLLAARYEEFTGMLEQMHDRIELGLKAFWYEGAAFDEVVRENEKICRMRDALERAPSGGNLLRAHPSGRGGREGPGGEAHARRGDDSLPHQAATSTRHGRTRS